MKRLIIIPFLTISTFLCAQVSFGHIDTNGAKGQCLFPEDANGFAELKEVVVFQGNKADVKANIVTWAASLGRFVDINALQTTGDIVSFHGLVEVDDDLPTFRSMTADSAKYYSKDESKLSFDCSVEIRDGRLRYKFSNIVSDRTAYIGSYIESVGPINDIVWNRMNGFRIQQANSWNKNGSAWDKAIRREWMLYKIEYQIIADMASSLKQCVKTSVEEEW